MTKADPSKEEIKKALDEMGIADTTLDEFLGSREKCREFCGKLQGDESVTEDTDLAHARYQVRARKFVKSLTAVVKPSKAKGDQPLKESAKKAEPASEPKAAAAEAAASPKQEQGMATKKVTKKGKAKAKPVKAAKAKGTAPKKAGVIDALKEILKAGGGTVEQIYAKLAKKFPDRGEGMKTTIRIQVNRLVKQGTMKVKREKVGDSNEVKYWA